MQALVTETLHNGFKLYVHAHDRPKGHAHLRLVVRVGSLAEEDEERGLAHMVRFGIQLPSCT